MSDLYQPLQKASMRLEFLCIAVPAFCLGVHQGYSSCHIPCAKNIDNGSFSLLPFSIPIYLGMLNQFAYPTFLLLCQSSHKTHNRYALILPQLTMTLSRFRDEFLLSILEKIWIQLLMQIFQIPVEQGLSELRKLGIEHRLWEASRKEVDQDSTIARKLT